MLLKFTKCYWKSSNVIENYQKILKIIQCYWKSSKVDQICWKLIKLSNSKSSKVTENCQMLLKKCFKLSKVVEMPKNLSINDFYLVKS
jgi:hypothetical protein